MPAKNAIVARCPPASGRRNMDYRRIAGTQTESPKQALQPKTVKIRDIIEPYIAATRKFVEDSAESGINVGDIINALPDSLGAYRFVLCAAITRYCAGQR